MYTFLHKIILAKMRRRSNINLKLIAQMLRKAGFDHIITVDMHSKESQGFFDSAIDNLRASPFLIQYIQECVSHLIFINISIEKYFIICSKPLFDKNLIKYDYLKMF